jgi:cell wall assembly regulator SMI1
MALFRNIKEFFHNITTSDHYAQYDRPLPGQGQQGIGNSPSRGNTPRNSSQISLGRGNSNNNVSTAALVGQGRASSSSLNLANHGNGSNTNLAGNNNGKSLPYRPGMRSQLHNDSQIELRNYENGQPIRSIAELWDHIDDWLETEFPELGDDIQGGATANDLNAFEEDLGINLPTGFRESYQIHDGQVTMGKARGLIFTYQLMDLETIAAETNIWRKVYNRFEKNDMGNTQESSSKGAIHSGTADRFGVQRSCPPGFVNELYYDPLWIPFVKDNVGNNIALDLNPGEAGTWGQVILFGRDYDIKFVVADSFSEFLSNICTALEEDHGEVDEDEDLNYVYNGKVYNYFDVLKSKSITRARKLDSTFSIEEKKTHDVDLLISKQRPTTSSTSQVPSKRNPALDIRREENNNNNNSSYNTPPTLNSETLPNETLISPVYPSASKEKKRDFTPSKDNIATNDSFVIDDDVLSVEEPIEPTPTAVDVEVETPAASQLTTAAEPVSVADAVQEVIEENKEKESEAPVTTEEPATEEPATEEPVVEEPVVEEPAVEEPAVEEPAVEEPAVEEPAVEEPAVEEPAVEEPAVEEPAVEEPVLASETPETPETPELETEAEAEAEAEVEAEVEAEAEEVEADTEEKAEDPAKTPAAGKKNNKKKNKKKGRK